MSETIDKDEAVRSVLECLNTAFQNDRSAMQALLCNRVPCNRELAEHPTVQVGLFPATEEGFHVGMLGVINGVLSSAGLPKVAARFSEEPVKGDQHQLEGFQLYEEPETSGR